MTTTRCASRRSFRPDGGMDLLRRTEAGAFEPFESIGPDDALTTQPIGFDKAGQTSVPDRLAGPRHGGAVQPGPGDRREDAARRGCARRRRERADPSARRRRIQAVSFNYDRVRWQCSTRTPATDLKYLQGVTDGEINVLSRTSDDARWVVAYVKDNGPVRYYVYDRPAHAAKFLFTNRPGARIRHAGADASAADQGARRLDARQLSVAARVGPIATATGGPHAAADGALRPRRSVGPRRVGLQRDSPVAGQPRLRGAVGELSRVDRLRQEVPERRQPRVGGQDARRSARRGEVGRRPEHRRPEEGRDHRRLVRRLRDARRPDVHARRLRGRRGHRRAVEPGRRCSARSRRTGSRRSSCSRRASATTAPTKGASSWSPLAVDARRTRSSKPLLIGQGANDPRVKQAESDQIVKAMQAKNIPVTYVLFPGRRPRVRQAREQHRVHRHQRRRSSRSTWADAPSRSATRSRGQVDRRAAGEQSSCPASRTRCRLRPSRARRSDDAGRPLPGAGTKHDLLVPARGGLRASGRRSDQRTGLPVVLFEGARLITSAGAPIEDSAFLVDSGRFTAVGARGAVQCAARRDGRRSARQDRDARARRRAQSSWATPTCAQAITRRRATRATTCSINSAAMRTTASPRR